MPKVRRSKKPPPDGWELIEPTLDEIEQKMREGNFIRVPILSLRQQREKQASLTFLYAYQTIR